MAFTAPKFNQDIRVYGNIFSTKSAFQQPVLDIQTDAVLDPGATPTIGDRYIIEDSAALHANFGTITGVGNDDIVEYDGSNFIIAWDASVNGAGACTHDKDSNIKYCFNGSEWSTESHPGGGDGLTFNGGDNRFDIDLANTNPGMELTASDGTGKLQLSAQGNGIVGGSGSLLSADPATEVAGSRAAVYVGADGIGIDLDNSTLDHSTSTLQVKALGIDTAQLAADAVDGTKIADDAVDSEHLAADAVDLTALDHASTMLRSGALTDPFTAGLTRTFTHNWATTDVQVEVYDVTTGETCYAYVSRAANSVSITLNQTPTNSLRVLLRELNATETTIIAS